MKSDLFRASFNDEATFGDFPVFGMVWNQGCGTLVVWNQGCGTLAFYSYIAISHRPSHQIPIRGVTTHDQEDTRVIKNH